MTLVAVLGDVATTTSLAALAAWTAHDPWDRPAIAIELDPLGGSIGAWCDLPASPTLSTVVTRATDGGWPAVEPLAHRTASGLRVIPAPPRSLEATQAVAESERRLVDLLAADVPAVLIADLGAPVPARGLPLTVERADVCVVVHRQATQSARAAAVRVERLAELVDAVAATCSSWLLAVVGATPFDPVEILGFVAGPYTTDDARLPLVELADDPLAAAVLAGRRGVSPRRFARLPLVRSANTLVAAITAMLDAQRDSGRSEIV